MSESLGSPASFRQSFVTFAPVRYRNMSAMTRPKYPMSQRTTANIRKWRRYRLIRPGRGIMRRYYRTATKTLTNEKRKQQAKIAPWKIRSLYRCPTPSRPSVMCKVAVTRCCRCKGSQYEIVLYCGLRKDDHIHGILSRWGSPNLSCGGCVGVGGRRPASWQRDGGLSVIMYTNVICYALDIMESRSRGG